jgi:Uma2 family endonuclease
MTAVETVQRMTAEEFMALPVGPDDPGIYELVEGELVVHSPSGLHGDIQQTLLVALTNWTRAGARRRGLGTPGSVS